MIYLIKNNNVFNVIKVTFNPILEHEKKTNQVFRILISPNL